MGTRHLICAVVDREYKLAQYGQWDGYPEGQGIKLLRFLSNVDIETFRNKLKRLSFLTNEDLVQIENEIRDVKDWTAKYPELDRDTGADILTLIDNDVSKVQSSLSFAGDSLFCEWCYVIDFDKHSFEIFKGSNKKPVKRGRFLSNDCSLEGFNNSPRKYHPVKLVKTYSLDHLPTQDEFLQV